MGANVFANNMEVSGKASDNRSIAAMPDVCLSPPSPPAGPVPIPYPNTGMASDTTNGSTSVKIGGKEVGLKNKSKYSKSDGDQPATKSFGGGVVSHNITGPVYFSAWSFDVFVEGYNVTRFGDLTTGNHMTSPEGGNAAITGSVAGMDVAIAAEPGNECEALQKANEEARDPNNRPGKKRDPSAEHGGVAKALDPENNHALTHGIFTPAGGAPQVVRASSVLAPEKYDNSFSKFPRDKQGKGRTGGPSNMNGKGDCGPHEYASNPAAPFTCHTEARIIEQIFQGTASGAGGKLVLAIDWPRPRKGKRPCDPCDDCNKLICAASKCMDIKICNEDGEQEDGCKQS